MVPGNFQRVSAGDVLLIQKDGSLQKVMVSNQLRASVMPEQQALFIQRNPYPPFSIIQMVNLKHGYFN